MLDSIDMEWLLQREGVSYKESYGRSGRQLNVRECPFCHGSGYKVYINAENGVGNCFSGSCPQGTFSKWTLLKGLFDLDGRRLVELLRELAREQGWRPKIVAAPLGLRDLNTLELPDSTPAWEMEQIHEYLARRGITKSLAEYFSLYWSESGVWEYMDPRGFSLKQDYSNRILIPIFDLDGDMVSFQGRDVTGEHEQRYLFPPGFASAGAYLYNGLNVTAETKAIVIAEGVFDVIQAKRALAADDSTAAYEPIGTFGMHLSSGNPSGDDQMGRLRKIKDEKGIREVIFLWDGERKAANAAVVAGLQLRELGFLPKIAFVPDGKDPGTCYPEEIRSAVLSALPLRNKLEGMKVMREIKLRYKTA